MTPKHALAGYGHLASGLLGKYSPSLKSASSAAARGFSWSEPCLANKKTSQDGSHHEFRGSGERVGESKIVFTCAFLYTRVCSSCLQKCVGTISGRLFTSIVYPGLGLWVFPISIF